MAGFEEALKALCAEYRASLPLKFAELDRLWRRVRVDSQVDALAELRRELHSIAGSGKTFGLPALSAAASAAEACIEAWRESGALPGAQEGARFGGLLDELKRAGQS
ncbi:MAG: Hpt domain-containing protein [Burkholderiales bacterium]|nr:Hpt domain-containing protein [Burkholderiales bacterium]